MDARNVLTTAGGEFREPGSGPGCLRESVLLSGTNRLANTGHPTGIVSRIMRRLLFHKRFSVRAGPG